MSEKIPIFVIFNGHLELHFAYLENMYLNLDFFGIPIKYKVSCTSKGYLITYNDVTEVIPLQNEDMLFYMNQLVRQRIIKRLKSSTKEVYTHFSSI